MTDKFTVYDVFGLLVPGVLLLAVGGYLFPLPIKTIISESPPVPDAFVVLVLTAIGIMIGHLLQVFGSMLERLLFKTFGGRPSEQAITDGLGDVLPLASASRVISVLKKELETEATNRSLFLFAMQAARSLPSSRVEHFNALFAYQRSLVVFSLVGVSLTVLSRYVGAAVNWHACGFWICIVMWLIFGFLSWLRCKQRSYYYVREVLLSSERYILDKRKGA